MSEISNYYEHQFSEKAPSSLVVLCHGLGSNGQDLISLAPLWSQALPDTLFVSPDAPFPCDMVPPGYPNAFQWFSLQDRDPDKVLQGVESAAPILTHFLDSLLEKFGLLPESLALVGFSQGTMMSLHVGPHYKDKIAGILGYSGALVWDADTQPEDLQKPPVRLIHGAADDVVPIQAYDIAKETLMSSGFDVTGHTTPGLTHSIDERGIESGFAFLKQIFSV